MLYKFKSQVAADVIMLRPNAEELLEIIGKPAGATGIITVDQAQAAVMALRAEIEKREAAGQPEAVEPRQDAEQPGDAAHEEAVSLRRRAAPFIDLLERSSAAGKDVVWGV